MKSLKTNIFFKIGMIFLLILILLIPTALVKGLIDDREYRHIEAINEVSDKWSGEQVLTGPFISIPYDRYVTHSVSQGDSIVKKTVKEQHFMHILPDNLSITGNILPEKRYRGIYEVVVYESMLNISGDFAGFDFNNINIEKDNIHLEKATIHLGISDLKGIEEHISINWNGKAFSFDSGVTNRNLVSSGINLQLDLSQDITKRNTFSTALHLKGSHKMYFTPIGKTTDLHLASTWPTPSFSGKFLPDDREINQDGFKAHWNVLHLNRNYPQFWTEGAYHISESNFGIDLLLPVDSYKKSDRVAKYAILFIVLTFLVFFFVEILGNVFIHPIQYLLIGLALIVFYSLLLSISEHLLFNLAYGIATLLTITLVSLYASAVLKSKRLAWTVFGILLIMYAFLFIIIQLENYALLLGNFGIFTILSVVMYHSKNIDWYNIQLKEK